MFTPEQADELIKATRQLIDACNRLEALGMKEINNANETFRKIPSNRKAEFKSLMNEMYNITDESNVEW